MEDFFRFEVGIEKKKIEKILSVNRESSQELSLESRVNFLAISQNSQEHLPGKFQAESEFLVHSYTFYNFQMAITL